MKKVILGSCLLVSTFFAQGQILKKITDRAKQRSLDKINQKVNTTTDNAVDTAFSKTEQTVKDVIKGNTGKSGDSTSNNDTISANPSTIKAYSKYDFVPGEKIIGFEDFMTGSIGDFPSGWDTNGSAEIVTIDGKPGRWLMISKPGVFVPEFTNKLPADFTFEFDLLHGTPFSGSNSVVLFLNLVQLQNTDKPQDWGVANNRYTLTFLPGNTGNVTGWSTSERRKNGSGEDAVTNETKQLGDQSNPVHISIWRQKERVKVYMNEEKVWDVPKALATDAELNSLVFFLKYAEPASVYYLGNLRMAVGAPDTRNKFLTESKWVTHGILFDVSSANIKPESYGSLKEMANVLKENPDLKVNIIGHTDADGKDDANLDLSKRRAASVKAALVKEFSIDKSRMETDGKGESDPIDKNDNPAGKANNRRVEFIKI